jgi:hypothetical protein
MSVSSEDGLRDGGVLPLGRSQLRERVDGQTLRRLFLPGVLLAMLVAELAILLTRSFTTGMGQDFTSLYVAALAWLHGYSPYTSQAPVHLAAALHVRWQGDMEQPLLLAVFAPLAALPPYAAFVVYVLLQDVLISGGALLLAHALDYRHPRLLALAFVASPPAFLVDYYGQIGALVYAVATLAWWARRRGHAATLGLAVAASLVKPQLGLCTALPLMWGAPRRAWLAMGAGCASLLGASLAILGPAGSLDYLRVLHAFSASSMSLQSGSDGLGLASLYQAWLAPQSSALLTQGVTIVVTLAILALVVRWRARPPTSTIALLVPLLVLVLPYSHQYDSIVLLPALAVTGQQVAPHAMARVLFCLSVFLVAATPVIALSTASIPFRLLPLGLLLWSACGLMLERWRRHDDNHGCASPGPTGVQWRPTGADR